MVTTATHKKPRTVKDKSVYQKNLKAVRDRLPTSVLEVEIIPTKDTFSYTTTQQGKTIQHNNALTHVLSVSEHMRVIRNTVTGELFKFYQQMMRTKECRRLLKSYKRLQQSIHALKQKEALSPTDNQLLKSLSQQRKETASALEAMKVRFSVTKSFAVDYAAMLRKTRFAKPDAVLALKCADRAWLAMERVMFGDAKSPNFLKKGDYPSLEGKQANRCLILKPEGDNFFLHFGPTTFQLTPKKDDWFVLDTLERIRLCMEQGEAMDAENVALHLKGESPLPTYRVKYNRIVIKEIRGRKRLFLQMCLEGPPLLKRKKDGSPRHTYGTGRVGVDVGTQSQAVAAKDAVILKNLAQRCDKTLLFERKVRLLQRKLTRSRIANNPSFFNEDGTAKKRSERPKVPWQESKAYQKMKQKLKNMHRIAADSRQYAAHEDVNLIRRLGDHLITETMNIKSLQKRAKDTTHNKKTGRINRKKRFGKSIQNRCPGYFISRLKYIFTMTGGQYSEVNTWSFKASQYDHMLNTANKKQLSNRWHTLPDGRKVQRDCYSSMLLYCSKDTLDVPDTKRCNDYFDRFYRLHNKCIQEIITTQTKVMNSGIKIA